MNCNKCHGKGFTIEEKLIDGINDLITETCEVCNGTGIIEENPKLINAPTHGLSRLAEDNRIYVYDEYIEVEREAKAKYFLVRYDNNEEVRKAMAYLAGLLERYDPWTSEDIREIIKTTLEG